MSKQKILELYAGPGSGKSTMAAYVFAGLKLEGYNVELVREFAKEVVWRNGQILPYVSQEELLAEQAQRQVDLLGKVDLIITDSPLLQSVAYGSSREDVDYFNESFERYPVFVRRVKPYNPVGREQTEEEAWEKDKQTRLLVPTAYAFNGNEAGCDACLTYARSIITQ